jgi:FAD/FMN-containing dehydrogenase
MRILKAYLGSRMIRRNLMKYSGAAALVASRANAQGSGPFKRVRPGEPGWPSDAKWQELNAKVGGQLLRVSSPLDACKRHDKAACDVVFKGFKNPYFIRDNMALTQTTGWVDAWTSAPSAYSVDVRNAADVAAAVSFARDNRLRLVVRGGAHSYLGTSNAADSLMVRTRSMDQIAIHDAFVPQGCSDAPRQAVSVGTGNIWLKVYAAVTKAGRYAQGGGCCTVNVGGFLSGGGFGSFSKRFGLAAASLLEAEIVTADGQVRIANACTNPDLFWALKGGGASFGVLTRVTLKTHELPNFLGGTFGAVKAHSDEAFTRLMSEFMRFYRDKLFNPTWGEQVKFRPSNELEIAMVFQGIDQVTANAVWKPFVDWLTAARADYSITLPIRSLAAPAHFFWDVEFLKKNLPGVILHDDRPGAPDDAVFWAGNLGEAGWYIHNYESVWMPQSLLADGARDRLIEAMFAASRKWSFGYHFNKGLGGASPDVVAAARETPMHPAAAGAFALVIVAAGGPPAFTGIAGHEPDLAKARLDAAAVSASLAELSKLAPGMPAYSLEASYFQKNWQQAFWGGNYERLRAVKNKYDPDGLVFIHHGVGSEDWSADGFSRVR